MAHSTRGRRNGVPRRVTRACKHKGFHKGCKRCLMELPGSWIVQEQTKLTK